MNKLKVFFFTFLCLALLIGIYSCQKEKSDILNGAEKTKINNGASITLTGVPLSKGEIQELLNRKSDSSINVDARSLLASTCFEQPSGNCAQLSGQTAIGSLPAQLFPAPVGLRPACNDMQITFDVLQCYDLSTGLWSFSFSNFSADIGNCPAFIAWFNSLSPADQSSQIDNWEYSLSEVTEQTYIQNFFLNSPVPYMTCPKQTFNSEFSTEICTYRCLTFKSDGKPVIIRNFCGSQCCIRSIEGCINVSGFYQTLGPPTFTTKGATCPEDFELPNCPPNSILLDKKCGKVCGPH